MNLGATSFSVLISKKRNEKRNSDKNILGAFQLNEGIKNSSNDRSITSIKAKRFKYSNNKKKRPIGIKIGMRYSKIEKERMSPMQNFEDLFKPKNFHSLNSVSITEHETYELPQINPESSTKNVQSNNSFKQRFSMQHKKLEPIRTICSFRNRRSTMNADSGDDNSSHSPMTSTIKPPLHPLVLKKKEETFEEEISNLKAQNTPLGNDTPPQQLYKSKTRGPATEDEIMSILVNKVVENNVYKDYEEGKEEVQTEEFDYFNDKLLKFKLMKVKNILAPTYEMNKEEGEKIRHKIKMDAQNEMDTIIKKTLNENLKLSKKGKTRILQKKLTEVSSDSTSEGSNSFQSSHMKGKNHLKNRVIRIKQKKKNKKSLMSKLDVIRNNIYRKKMTENVNTKSLNHTNDPFLSLQDLKKETKRKGIFDRKKEAKNGLKSTLDTHSEQTKRSVLNLNHVEDFFEDHE
ncbi:unnamed protein product [Moneuplotes crassus]|uniref:Uncharacterized protein n=1 Tax=Euplotes crassus TaxID=5936 RepID=A0AAD2DB59_EUPCR|nr:unnamed protein product [Moneuplotes crassus]